MENGPICYTCGTHGHASTSCRNEIAKKSRCHKCGAVGHFARACRAAPNHSQAPHQGVRFTPASTLPPYHNHQPHRLPQDDVLKHYSLANSLLCSHVEDLSDTLRSSSSDASKSSAQIIACIRLILAHSEQFLASVAIGVPLASLTKKPFDDAVSEYEQTLALLSDPANPSFDTQRKLTSRGWFPHEIVHDELSCRSPWLPRQLAREAAADTPAVIPSSCAQFADHFVSTGLVNSSDVPAACSGSTN